MTRILVTGATGFIGRALVPRLVVRPATAVTLLLRESYGAGQPLPPELAAIRSQYDVAYGDLRSYQLTSRAVRQAEPNAVVHLAAVGVTDPFLAVETALRHNVTGTINLLRACFEQPFAPQKLIVARTPGERSSMNVYAASKAAAWNFCAMYARTQGWPIQGAMIFQAYGPGQSPKNLVAAAMAAAQAGQDFPLTAGTQQKDWIAVSDAVAGLLAMLDVPLAAGVTVELGTGQTTSVADVVRLIYALAGQGGQPLVGVLPGRPGEELVQVANVAQTKALLSWQTAVALPQGLQKLLQK